MNETEMITHENRSMYAYLSLAALAITGIPELTASIGYGGSPVTTAVAMLALGVLAGIGGNGKPWQYMLAAVVLLPVGGALSYILGAETTGFSEVLQIVLFPVFYAAAVFAGSLAIHSVAEGKKAETWRAWLLENRDGLEAFLFGAIAAGMFPYISILWPVGSLLAAGVAAYRYPDRVWRHSIAITVAFLGIAFLRVLSDIIVDVTTHEMFPFEFVVTFLLSAPFSFFGAAGVSKLARKNG